MGPVRSSTSSIPPGAYSPCCHHGAGNYSNTQAITVQPGTHSLLGRESTHTGEVLAQGHSATPRELRPAPETSRFKVTSRSHRVTTPSMCIECICRYRDTEGSHCQGACRPQQFLYICPSQCHRDGTATCVVMRAMRDTQSQC